MKSKAKSKSIKRIGFKGRAHIGVDLHDSTTSFGIMDSEGKRHEISKVPTSPFLLIDHDGRVNADEIHNV